MGAVRAGPKLLELMDCESRNVQFHATQLALRINGLMPSDNAGTQVNVNVQPGYVINLERATEAPETVTTTDYQEITEA